MVVLPLIGFSFQLDQRSEIYRSAVEGFGHPLEAARDAYSGIGEYLSRGNFRPIGRFLENFSHGFVFEAAEATGMAPHVVHGLVRIAMIGLLALTATQMVAAVMRSARTAPTDHPAYVLYPLILAATLVAGDADGPLTIYPFTLIGTSVFILAVGLAVARDRDMGIRPLAWHEAPSMFLLGAATAMTYDLAYVATPLAAAFVVCRTVVGGGSPKFALRTAALRRSVALGIGFLTVFVPVRIEIASRCSQTDCYSGSDIQLSGDILRLSADRLLTGAPPAGWYHTEKLAGRASRFEFSLADVAANSLLVLLLVAIVVVTVRTARRATRRTETAGEDGSSWVRLAAGLALCGAATAALPAMLVSLSRFLHFFQYAVGEAWRDTLLVQVGWSFMLAAAVVALTGAVRSTEKSRIAVVAVAAILGAGCIATLLANEQLAQIDRRMTLPSINNQISEATINFNLTDSGNVLRCGLINDYADFRERSGGMDQTKQLGVTLDRLMLDRYGQPFCDPARITAKGT